MVADLAHPIPAATLVILREASAGAPELLMVERARAMVFAGGALVFPGGRVDPADHAMASGMDGDPDDIAARVAAIRETVEEAGLAIGFASLPSAEAVERVRAALHADTAFNDALRATGGAVDLGSLMPFARWRPSHKTTRIFDTRFYLARLPTGSPQARVDATENVRLFWSTAAAVLADADAGRATLIYPTRRNLERLAQFRTVDEAFADARQHPVETITPVVEDRGGVPHLCIPEGLGYPVTAEPMATAMRG